MKFLLLVLLIGCVTPPTTKTRDRQSHKEKVAERIENCILRFVDQGVDESLVYEYCSKIHRPGSTILKPVDKENE